MYTTTESKLYLHTPHTNAGNADSTIYADGWPVSVKVIRGSVVEVAEEISEVEGYVFDYEYPDATNADIYETQDEMNTRRTDATRLAHNATRKAAIDAIPTWKLERRQLRLALIASGIGLAPIQAYIDGAGDEALTVYWEDTTEYHFDHPLIVAACGTLGITDPQRVALWELGKGIE